MVALVDLVDEPFTCDCGAEVHTRELAAIVIKPHPLFSARSVCLECVRLDMLADRARRDTERAIGIAANLDELEPG
jgi:hypothetical protein